MSHIALESKTDSNYIDPLNITFALNVCKVSEYL